MRTKNRLTRELQAQTAEIPCVKHNDIDRYIPVAKGYADIENLMVVLSDLSLNESIVIHGGFSHIIDIDTAKYSGRIPSIWEDGIFSSVHPDDLEMKLLQELLFFHHINKLPHNRKFRQCLMQKLRMRNRNGQWTDVLHRLYYIPDNDKKTIRFALCLYGAITTHIPASAIIVDTLTGNIDILDYSASGRILSRKEIEVLRLIDCGNSSKDIAGKLNISIHTVSRHRQNIIAKLKVRNSAEACKTARNLSII